MRKPTHIIILILFLAVLLSACVDNSAQPGQSTPGASGGDVTLSDTPTPTAVPTTLVVCLGEQPNTLYPFGEPNQAAREVLQALFDGPIDHLGYQYQSVLVEAVPSIAEQTAVIQTVQVVPGDTVVDNQGNVITLDYGQFVRPTGCFSADCAVAYDGNALEMDQMIALFTLKTGLTWSDGTPLTAQDSVYGFTLNADADTPADKYRVELTLTY